MNKFLWIQLLSILLVATTTSSIAMAQDDGDFAPTVVSPSNEADEPVITPGMAMPPDGEFDAAPAPSDWEEDAGEEEIEGEDF